MANVYKMTEIVAISDKCFSDAVREGVKRASKTIRHLSWFEVVEQRGLIKDGNVAEFQVKIRLGFKLDAE